MGACAHRRIQVTALVSRLVYIAHPSGQCELWPCFVRLKKVEIICNVGNG